MKTTKLYSIFLMTIFAGICLAQSESPKPAPAEPTHYYRLDFVVKELEGGKVLNSRAYSTTLPTGERQRSVIRTGSRVPVSTKSGATTDVTYIDVGVNIDCGPLKEVQSLLDLNVIAEMSTIADDFQGPHAAGQPVIHQNRWSSTVLVPVRKATTIFSSDDATSKRQMQLELTATPIP